MKKINPYIVTVLSWLDLAVVLLVYAVCFIALLPAYIIVRLLLRYDDEIWTYVHVEYNRKLDKCKDLAIWLFNIFEP